MTYHEGYPHLRERHDLARPIYLGKEGGTPVVFWSRRVCTDTFRKGESLSRLLAIRPWRVERRGGTLRVYKDLRRH